MSALVSIIVPSYNHKKYLPELLQSIEAQTYTLKELIVVDDGSNDGSQEYLESVKEKYKIKLITKKNEGLCATINRGLSEASGQFVVIIASDDFMPAERLAEQVLKLSQSPYDAIAGGMNLMSETSQKLNYVKPLKTGEVFFTEMLYKNLIYAPTVMFKADTFKKFGIYNPNHLIEDYSMWLRILSQNGRIANFDCNWAFYRVNPAVTAKKVDWYYRGLVQVFSEYRDDTRVMKALQKRKLQYLIKVAVLEGSLGLGQILNSEKKDFGLLKLAFLYLVAYLPRFIRNFLKGFINRA